MKIQVETDRELVAKVIRAQRESAREKGCVDVTRSLSLICAASVLYLMSHQALENDDEVNAEKYWELGNAVVEAIPGCLAERAVRTLSK